jgi:hypothetical protein
VNFANENTAGGIIPQDVLDTLWDKDTRVGIECWIDFTGTGVFVQIPPEDIGSFKMNDSVEGTNGRATSNKASLHLHNYDHRYSPHNFTNDYDPAPAAGQPYKFNGPDQGDGRGNLRPMRRVRINAKILSANQVLPIFEGHISGDGFTEEVGKGNENQIKVDAFDYAKMLKDKTPGAEKVLVGGQYVEKDIVFENLKLCDMTNPNNSLLHQLVKLGDPLGHITINAQQNDLVIPFAPIKNNIWSELAELAEFMHGTVAMYGKFLFFGDSRFNQITPTGITFTNQHVTKYNNKDDTEKIVNKAWLEFSEYKQLGKVALWMYPGSSDYGVADKAVIFNDPKEIPPLYDDKVIFKAKYSVLPNTPVLAAGLVAGASAGGVTKTDADSLEVMSASNVGYDFFEINARKELSIFNTSTLRNTALLRAAIDGRTSTVLSKLVIYGEPIVRSEAHTSHYQNDSSIALYGEKPKTYKNKYMTRDIVTYGGSEMTRDLAWLKIVIDQNANPRRKHTFAVESPLVIARSGAYVQVLEDQQGSSINALVRLTSVAIDFSGKKNEWSVNFDAVEFKTLAGSTSAWTDTTALFAPKNSSPRMIMLNDPALDPNSVLPYQFGDMMVWIDGAVYRAIANRGYGEEFNIDDWVAVTIPIDSLDPPLPDIQTLQLVAGVDGIHMRWTGILGNVKYILQRSTDGGSIWFDTNGDAGGKFAVAGNTYTWLFNRATDGYPEKTADHGYVPLSQYQFRIKAVAFVKESENWLTAATIDTSAYLTWWPGALSGQSETAMRAASISWARPAVYGVLRYEIQIMLSGGSVWYEPAIGLDVYESEDNWRQGISQGVKTATFEQWNQELPLAGQDDGDSKNTTYLYRVRVVLNVPGTDTPDNKRAGPWSENITAVAKATSAYDIVRARRPDGTMETGALQAEHIFVDNLAAINGNLSVLSGGVDDPYNYWVLSDYPNRPPLRPVGSFRMGTATKYFHFDPAAGALKLKNIDIISGDRYGLDGDIVDGTSAGVFIGSNGVIKATDADGSGLEMVPDQSFYLKVGGRYDKDGDTVDTDADGVFIGSNGVLKSVNANGSGFEMADGKYQFKKISLNAGDRYDSNGNTINPSVAGSYIGVDGAFKSVDSNGAGIEMVPGQGATIHGLDLELTESNLRTFSGTGDDRHSLSHEGTAMVWRNQAEDGDPNVEIARIGYDNKWDKVLVSGLSKLMPSASCITIGGLLSFELHTSQVYNGKLYMPAHNGNLLEIYDFTTGQSTYSNVLSNHGRTTSAIYNGNLYLPRNGGTEMDIYNIAAGTRTTFTGLTSMSRSTCQVFSGKLYLPEYNGTRMDVYDFDTQGVRLITGLSNHMRWDSQIYNDKLYLPQHAGTGMDIFDLILETKDTVTGLLSTDRINTSQIHNGKLYLPHRTSNQMNIYDIGTSQITTVFNLSTSSRRTSAIYKGNLYLPRTNSTEMDIYNFTTGARSTFSGLTSYHGRFTSAIYNGKLYLPQSSGDEMNIYTIEEAYELGAGIIESGSNANGRYIKYSDGTMVCWGVGTTDSGQSQKQFTFPTPYFDTNFVVVGTLRRQYTAYNQVLIIVTPVSPDYFAGSSIRSDGGVFFTTPFTWQSAGRWRA